MDTKNVLESFLPVMPYHIVFLMCSSRAYLISETCPRQDWIPGSIRAQYCISQGRIQDLKLGGGALKNIAPPSARREQFRVKNHDFTPKNNISSNCGGRREHFWGISCEKSRFYAEKSRFYAKKSYFFQLRREARTFLRYFV